MKRFSTSFAPARRFSPILAACGMALLLITVAASKPVKEQLKGSWGLDAASMLVSMKDQLGQVGEEQRLAMEAQIKIMAESVMVRFGEEGKATLSSPGGDEKGTYVIENVNEEAATFKLTVTPEGEDGDAAEAKLTDDKLILTPPVGPAMTFVRLTDEEFTKRKKAAAAEGGNEGDKEAPAPEPAAEEAPAPEKAPVEPK